MDMLVLAPDENQFLPDQSNKLLIAKNSIPFFFHLSDDQGLSDLFKLSGREKENILLEIISIRYHPFSCTFEKIRKEFP